MDENDVRPGGLSSLRDGAVPSPPKASIPDAVVLPPDAAELLRRMDVGWGYPSRVMAKRMAEDDGPIMSGERILGLSKAFAALGWAERHQAFNEDDNYIRGSVYSLTPEGGKVSAKLLAQAIEARSAETERLGPTDESAVGTMRPTSPKGAS